MRRLLVFATLLMCSCAFTGERGSVFIDGPRVIAIQSEPASTSPGETVRLSALAVAPRRDADLEIVWYVCQYQTLEDCAQANDLVEIGRGPVIDTKIPEDTFAGETVVYWMDLVFPGGRERALKEVQVLAPGAPRNQNPVIEEVQLNGSVPIDGESITLEAGAQVGIWVDPEGNPAEIYSDSGMTTAEEIYVHTFTSGGQLVDLSGTGASGALEYRAPFEPGEYGIWIVLDDGRGGVGWKELWARIPEEQLP